MEGGFTLDDFNHQPDAGTVTCPAGISRAVSAKGNATFGTIRRSRLPWTVGA